MNEVFIPSLLIFFYLLRYCSRHFFILTGKLFLDTLISFGKLQILLWCLADPFGGPATPTEQNACFILQRCDRNLLNVSSRAFYLEGSIANTLKPSVTMKSDFVLAQSSTACKMDSAIQIQLFWYGFQTISHGATCYDVIPRPTLARSNFPDKCTMMCCELRSPCWNNNFINFSVTKLLLVHIGKIKSCLYNLKKKFQIENF